MPKKPTYEELEQRVKELEKEVAERREAGETLVSSERKYRDVVENAHDGIAIIQDGQLKFANQRLALMTGYTLEEAIDTPFAIYIDPDRLPKVVEMYNRRMSGEQLPEKYETGLRHKNGNRIDAEIAGGLITYRGKPADLVVVRDITDRKNMERALKDSEENYRGIIENMVDVYYRADLEGNLIAISPSGIKLLGYDSSEEMIGKNIAKEFYANPHEREYLRSEIMKHGKITFEGTLKRKDGTLIITETNSRVIRDKGGKPLAIEGICRDVTERKRMEEMLHRSRQELEMQVAERTAELVAKNKQLEAEISFRKRAEERLRQDEMKYRSFLSGLADTAYETDNEGNVTYVNKQVEELTGLPVEEIMGRPFLSLFVKESQVTALTVFRRTLNGESPEYELTFTSGKIAHFKNRPLTDDKGNFVGIFGIARDITERKKMEEALRTYKKAVESSEDIIAAVDSNYTYLFANRAFLSHHRLSQDEVVGRTVGDIIGRAEFAKSIKKNVDLCLKGECVEYEMSLTYPEIGKRHVSVSYYPLGGDEEEVAGVVAMIRDMTDRKRAEEALRKSNEVLRARTHSLDQLNTALKVLLERRERDKEELAENVVSNVKELILPYVETLRHTRLDTKQMTCVSIIEANLKEIVSPFLRKFASKYAGLTPKEMKVAGLIKQGYTTKEMAELFNLSARTVKFHRQNLRAKLGLKNQPINLASHLLSFL